MTNGEPRSIDVEGATVDKNANVTDRRLRTLQIIVLALAGGVGVFAIIASIMQPTSTVQPGQVNMLRIVCLVLLAVMAPFGLAFRTMSTASPHAAEPDDRAIMSRFFMSTIIGCATLEGPALFAAVIYLISRNPIDLLIAGIPLAMMIVLFFPTSMRFEDYRRNVRERQRQ